MTNLAGKSHNSGYSSGVASPSSEDNQSRLNAPSGVVCDRRGSVVVSDARNHVLRRYLKDAKHDVMYLQVWHTLHRLPSVRVFIPRTRRGTPHLPAPYL